MFQLIVTIISIALIVALALASIFYGGSAFTNSSAKSTEAALVNGGQQIAAAQILYSNDNGGSMGTLAALLATTSAGTTYLAATPSLPTSMGAWVVSTDGTVASATFQNPGVATAVCARVAVDNGGVAAGSVTDQATITAANLGAAQFNCQGSSLFAYKL
jgi:hypothetical protein